MPYFTVAELRAAVPDLADPVKYPDVFLDQERIDAEEALEEECHRAFEVRELVETVVAGAGHIRVSKPDPRELVALTVDGTVLTQDQWASAKRGWGRISGIPVTSGSTVTATYRHGMDAPPRRVRRATMTLVKMQVLKGPISDRATQVDTGAGTLNLATPGMFGSVFGIPEVDYVVHRYGIKSLGI